MSATPRVPLLPAADGVAGHCPGPLLTTVRRLQIDGRCELVTGDEETCVLVLAGTFDLQGGGTAWPSRGARTSPLVGRPVAVFLPPRTPFVANNGKGELLLLGAKQPIVEPPTGRAALQQRPLLQMAGSGKAFDPGSGEWRPAETFPTAPESLPPRRIEQMRLPGVTVERVFARDYKAATLCVDEVVIAPGATFLASALALPERAQEYAVYLRTEASGTVQHRSGSLAVAGETALWFSGNAASLTVQATTQPIYAVLAHAGK